MAQGDRGDFERQQEARQRKEAAGWEPRPGRKRNPAKGLALGSGAGSAPYGSRKHGKSEQQSEGDPPIRQPPRS
jgi:hypothetical protein